MLVREMCAADLDQVALLADQLGYPLKITDLDLRFKIVRVRKADKLFVACDCENRVTGWVHLQIQADLLTEPKGELRALVVDHTRRGQGIGKLLLAAGETWIRNQGVTKVFLRTNIAREEAHRFYKRENFVLSKTAHMFVKELALSDCESV